MAFPVTPLTPTVELQGVVTAGVWTNISSYVYAEDGITITRGRQDEQASLEPSTCSLTLNNRDGRFSPRNPTGAYYGKIGRNTPIRVSVNLGQTRLVADAYDDRANTSDSAGLSITGDIDIRIDTRLRTWDQFVTLVGKTGAAPQRSYALDLNSNGTLTLWWSADGTNWLTATSTVPVPQRTGRMAVRATLDVNNGAAGRTVVFYSAPTMSGTWTQIGDSVVQAGVTSIFDSTSGVSIGSGAPIGMETYSAKILQGIAGTERANPDFTAQTDGATSFVDAAGNTWTLGGAAITNKRTRFVGEVSTWPPKWDVSGRDVRVPVVAAGILRRLGQGASPLQSALRRGIPSESGVVAYWPMEDEDGAVQFASALTGGPALSISGAPQLASNESVAGSKPLPVIGGATFVGAVPPSVDGTIQGRFVTVIAAAGEPDGAVLMRMYTTGTVYTWDLVYSTASGGSFKLIGRDSLGATLVSSFATHTNVNGNLYQAAITITTSGANVAWELITVHIATDSGLVWSGTVAGDVGQCGGVSINPFANLTDTVVGHVHIRSSAASNPYGLENYVRGWVPETPGRRVARLCSEEGITFRSAGYPGPASGSAVGSFQGMGPQSTQTLLDLIGEAVTTDMGVLSEPRDDTGLAYRPRESLYSQMPALSLDYDNLADLEPVEDDQQSRNDVTVIRSDGSSARQVLETGALSIQAPPNGIGLYSEQISINVQADSALPQQARWRLHQGTIDEPRYPVIEVRLEAPDFSASPALTSAALDLEQGDLIEVANPPAWVPPDDIKQLALGFTETIEPFAYSIQINCTPASAWRVGIYDQGTPATRYAADGATLNAGITSTATGAAALSIVTPAGKPRWVSAAGNFPMDIFVGGECITLSAIANTASPQAATVSARSVNGVVKAHSAGAPIQVVDDGVYGL